VKVSERVQLHKPVVECRSLMRMGSEVPPFVPVLREWVSLL
jgi:hypothetical protein